MVVTAIKTALFREGDDLTTFIAQHLRRPKEGTILVVASKLVALAEGRVAQREKQKTLVKRESSQAVKTEGGWLTEKNGLLMWNAGIDESNGDGKLILLPKDSFRSAQRLRSSILQKARTIKNLGVIITDSRVFPLRAGVTGVALGYAGFKSLRDYRGTKDLFGRKLTMTQTNVVDCLATAAVLVMGEGKERQPLAVIEDAPVIFTKRVQKNELRMLPRDDMYAPLLRNFQKSNAKSKRSLV